MYRKSDAAYQLIHEFNTIKKDKIKGNKKQSNEVILKEILDITKVPFTKGSKRSIESRQKYTPKQTSHIKEDAKFRTKPLDQDSQIMEDIELNQLHSELLTRNISKGIKNANLNEENHILLPSFNKSSSTVINRKKAKNKLGQSSSMPRYSLNDFKASNQILKEQKQFINDKGNYSRFSVGNANSTQIYEKYKLNRNQNPSFISANAKNTTMDSIFRTVGTKNILSKYNPNASTLMLNSMSTVLKKSKLAE